MKLLKKNLPILSLTPKLSLVSKGEKMPPFMHGKTGLIMGVGNDHSIAWGIAQALHREGAKLAFTYHTEKTKVHVLPLFESLGATFYEMLEATDEEGYVRLFDKLKEYCGGRLDFLVHSIAGGPQKGELGGGVINVSRQGFLGSLEISVYSFILALRHARPLMAGHPAAALTLTYIGAERVVPHYDIMGVAKAALESSVRYLAHDLGQDKIRVNAVSAGSILTRAALGIPDFRQAIRGMTEKSPLGEPLETAHIGDAALFLLSDLSSQVTGQVLYVDGGYSIMGF